MTGLGGVLPAFGAAAALMVAVWALSVVRRDASLVDRFWGLGFVAVAWLQWPIAGPPTFRGLLVLALVSVWGLRLSWHIHRRNRGHGEDRRYAAMRERHGPRFPAVSLFTVFLLQAAILTVVASPLLPPLWSARQRPGALDAVGVALFVAGFLFEAIGDAQLARFKADPANRGQVLDRGLWRYTRHPNYFGDALVWWGLGLLGAATPGGWWTLVGPVLMTFLLRRVSGVTLLEEDLSGRKPGYRDYVERTPAFVPWFPRR